LLNEDPADQNHHSMHVYDDPAHGLSSVFQKEKKKKISLFFFSFFSSFFELTTFPLKIHIFINQKQPIKYLRNDFSDFGENRLSLQKSPS